MAVVGVVEHGQSGPDVDRSSATMLNSERSEGCSKMGLFRSRWVVKSLVHAWSLVIVVVSVMIAAIVVVVVLLPLTCFFLDALSHSSSGGCSLTLFPVSRGQNRMSQRVENRGSLISVPLALMVPRCWEKQHEKCHIVTPLP